MKERKVTRFTCDFCKKSNCKRDAMQAHELRCFKNPARRCPICQRQWPDEKLTKLIANMGNITSESEPALMMELREETDGCPACICAAISQATLPVHVCEDDFGRGEFRHHIDFNYKKEMDEYMAEQRAEAEPHY